MLAMFMGLKTMTPADLHARLSGDRPAIFDLNAPHSWRTARVPGATHLGVDFDPSVLPQDRAAALVFYCSNPLCSKAPRAARRAEKLGYTDVRVMSAGMTGWLSAQLPTDSGD
jgi:rhodanese-related sulfurtransferase